MRLPALLCRCSVIAGLMAAGLSAMADAPESAPANEAPAPDSAPASEAPAPQVERIPSPTERLATAVSAYQASQPDQAQILLAGLVNDETYEDTDLRQQARVYLGEVLYRKNDQEAARRVFERVLTENPEYRIDPFRHPPDVCGFFETIRAYIQPKKDQLPATAEVIPAMPSLGYVGFGIYQLKHKRKGVGSAMLLGQTIAGVVSVASFSYLLDNRRYPEGERDSVDEVRTAQWTSTTAFWGVWAWGVLDASRHWRATATPIPAGQSPPQSLLSPGIQLQVSGHFR